MTAAERPSRGQAYRVGVQRDGARRDGVEQHLAELGRLADTAGFTEAGRAILPRRTVHPATFIGRGQASEVGLFARGLEATLIILDEELSPAQSRNLERIFDLPVVDRAGLIIDILAERAQSRVVRTLSGGGSPSARNWLTSPSAAGSGRPSRRPASMR